MKGINREEGTEDNKKNIVTQILAFNNNTFTDTGICTYILYIAVNTRKKYNRGRH